MSPTIFRRLVLSAHLAPLALVVACGDAGPATVTLDAGERLQTIIGWEATAEIGDTDLSQEWVGRYREGLLDYMVDSVGLNALRLEVRSGSEHTEDRTPEYLEDVSRAGWWKELRYAPVNDNSDPFTIDPEGFQFTWLDHRVTTIVEPFRRRLAEHGEALYLTLTYVDFGESEFEQLSNPEEYAEFVLATFLHLDRAHGFVPDAVEILLEPDVGQVWEADAVAAALVATGDRLREHGFDPDFVAPSNASMSGALAYFDAMVEDEPRVLEYLTDLSYHRYRGVSPRTLSEIGERAERYGVRTAMLEHIGAGHEALHEDLKVGRVSRWQQYVMGWPEPADDATVYAIVTEASSERTRVVPSATTPLLRQYFLSVRAGAVRIGALSDNPKVDPLAFVNTDGSPVLIVKAAASSTVTVHGLPAGSLEVAFVSVHNESLEVDAVRTDDAGVSLVIPEAGVLTVKSGDRPVR